MAETYYEGSWSTKRQTAFELTWRTIAREANASVTAITDVNSAAGTYKRLKHARKHDIDPFAGNFTQKFAATMPRHGTDADNIHLPHHRQRRQLVAIGAAIGFGMSIYNLIQIQSIKAEVAKASEERQLIAHAVSELSTRTNKIATALGKLQEKVMQGHTLTEMTELGTALLSNLQDLESHLTSVVNQAMMQRVDVSLVNEEAWRSEVRQLAWRADHQTLELALLEPADIVRLEASVSLSAEGTLEFIIPIPLFSRRLEMTLWQLQQLPIKTREGWMQVATSTTYLATTRSPSSIFFTMTPDEVARCYPVGGANLCPPAERTYKENRKLTGLHEARCLFSLFRKWEEDTKRHCSLTFVQQEEDAMRIAARRWVLFNSFPDDVSFSCRDGSTTDKRLLPGLNFVDVPHNCVAETQSVYLQPHVDIEPLQTAHDKTIAFPPAIQEVANATTNTLLEVRDTMQELGLHLAPTPALDQLNAALEDFGQSAARDPATKFLIAVVAIALIGGVIGVAICAVKKCQKKKTPTEGGKATTTNNISLNLANPTFSRNQQPGEVLPKDLTASAPLSLY